DGRHRRALNGRQEDATHRIAHGRSKAALERLGIESPDRARQRLALEPQPLWPLKTLPQHGYCPFAAAPSGLPDLHCWSPTSRRRSESCGPVTGTCRDAYFEYNSTISGPCTGRLICSRVGSDDTRPASLAESKLSHSGIPRPF